MKLDKFFLTIGIAVLAIAFGHIAVLHAGYQGEGTYVNTAQVTVSASATTLIISGNGLSQDLTCRNNSSSTLWIGSNTANNDLYRIGFFVLSSETFKAAAYSGPVYGQGDGAAVDVRCWSGLINP